MSANKTLLIMAAGTGGHIMPGLAVAREMQARGWSVSWLGTRTGMENRLVPPTGIEMDTIDFAGVRGKGSVGGLLGGFKLLQAFWYCLKILRSRRPTVVLGMGGYVCLPGAMMASLLGKPLALVNADAALLLSNKLLAPLADKIAFGLPSDDVAGLRQAVVTGNPVRPEVEAISIPAERMRGRMGKLRLLVVGGSLGAKVLNETLPVALSLIPEADRPTVTHQTGAAHFEMVQGAYAASHVSAAVVPFIDDMAAQLAEADVIVCRAGAITVSELCAAGVASVLVPLVLSTTSHQRDNALMMARAGAATHLPQSELSAQKLADLLQSLTRPSLLAMAERARSLAKPGAAARVAHLIEGLAP